MIINIKFSPLTGGIRLPTSQRQRVHPNGTLVVDHVRRDQDQGEYSCTANNRQGHSDTKSMNLKILGWYIIV